jgi:hypothetical protein
LTSNSIEGRLDLLIKPVLRGFVSSREGGIAHLGVTG